jgi:hypothetical protein
MRCIPREHFTTSTCLDHHANQDKGIALAGTLTLGDRKLVALALRQPARRGRPSLKPAQQTACAGFAENVGSKLTLLRCNCLCSIRDGMKVVADDISRMLCWLGRSLAEKG